MAYALHNTANLGRSGLTVYASLAGTDGADVAGHTDIGPLTEIGASGVYRLYKADFPDDFRGEMHFHTGTVAGGDKAVLAAVAVNPEEAEYQDARASSRQPSGPVDLSPTGLDAIPADAPAGVAGTFREMVVQTWRRLFKRSTLTSAGELTTYADDGTTELTQQTLSDDGTTQTQGSASGGAS